MRRSLLIVAALLAPALASAVEVISPRADSVRITVYRDLFAMVTETRTVDLPAEAVTLSFDGVVETLIPASAVVTHLDRKLEERNYDYEQLSPASLLRKSIGKSVVLTRTLPGSGKVRHIDAVIESANEDGVTLRTADGHEALRCSGLPEGISFEEIPGELSPVPRLSVKLAAGRPGKRTIAISYIAQGFAWNSDYVGRLATDGKSIDLTGWVTLRNFTRASFRDAEVQMVAGRLNLLYDEEGGSSTIGNTSDFENESDMQEARDSRLSELTEGREESERDWSLLQGCYPLGPPRVAPVEDRFQRSQRFGDIRTRGEYSGDLEQVIVTGSRRSIAPPERLADYHLYRIPWPTDLNARQTKQVVFLQKSRVKTEMFYSFRMDPDEDFREEPIQAPLVMLSFENRKSSGLGEPLPGGMLRLFNRTEGSDVFAGESRLPDKAVDTPVELIVGKAVDLSLDVHTDDDPEDVSEDDDREYFDVHCLVSSAKPWPVTLEVRLNLDEELEARIVRSNQRTQKKSGDFMWRFTVPPLGSTTLDFRLAEAD